MLLTFILIVTSIPLPPSLFHSKLKPSFSANLSHYYAANIYTYSY